MPWANDIDYHLLSGVTDQLLHRNCRLAKYLVVLLEKNLLRQRIATDIQMNQYDKRYEIFFVISFSTWFLEIYGNIIKWIAWSICRGIVDLDP